MSITIARSILLRGITRSSAGTAAGRSYAATVPVLKRTSAFRGYSSQKHGSDRQNGSGTGSGPSSRPASGNSNFRVAGGIIGIGLTATLVYLYRDTLFPSSDAQNSATSFKPSESDYQKVYDHIAALLAEKDDYEDGSYGPVLLRLAWHASGTYDKESNTGGSNGATMRFPPESSQEANAGLGGARDFLEPVKEHFPWISYSDLWILAGVCAIQEMQGPSIPWRPGRIDGDVRGCAPNGRLPDATKGTKHLRDIFYRMGFNDQEIVALSGAHALGRCHTDRSGFSGPWTFAPTVLTNDYFRLLVDEKWQLKKWDGPAQYEDKKTKSLMMLPTDMSLLDDKNMLYHVEKYAKDQEAFFKDFSAVILKLFELGVPFGERNEPKRLELKPSWA